MKKTLQDQYLLIKEGKGHKGVFLSEAKRQFPNIVRNAATFDEAAASLITKNIISENVIGLGAINSPFEVKKKQSFETAFESFLAEAKKKENEEEKVKAEEKKVSKPVEEDYARNFDRKDDKNIDNLIFDQVMTGYYAEMKDPKNADKTMQELKDIVMKNLQKDPIHYTKDGQFGVKGLGYTMDAPGLGEPKEAKGKYKSSGYGDLKESQMYYTDEDDEDESDIVSKLMQMGVSPLVIDSIRKTKGIEGLKDRLREKDVRNMSWTKGFNEEETKLREVVRKMIAEELEEAYQMPSVNTSGKGGAGGRRFIPSQLPFPQNIRRRFGEHIVYNPGSQTLYISDILYNNLVKGYGDQPAIKKLIMDIPPMVKQILNKPDNYGPTTELPKEFRVYHPLNAEVEKAKADKFNKAGDKQYWSESDFLIPNLNIMEEGEMEPLRESVEKDLADINKEAEQEVLQSKMEKIQALIDKKQSQISRLDEDEDMKDLTDDKKVKEISKDIKALEKAKVKLEKIMSKFKGKKTSSKKVIDEMDNADAVVADVPEDIKRDALKRLEIGREEIDSILSNYQNISFDDRNHLRMWLDSKKASNPRLDQELNDEDPE
jgi:hypothetical protein